MAAFRLSRFLPSLALVLAFGTRLEAQNVVLDEGAFRLSRQGREIGTETFTIRRVGLGDEAHLIANAVIEMDLPSGHEQVRPLLRAAPDLSVSEYQLTVSGSAPKEIAVTLNGRRFVARTRTPSGEQEREYRASPGAVVLDEGVAHQYWFLSRLAPGTDVTALVPRSGSQRRVRLKESRPETIDSAGAQLSATHATLELDGSVHEVWWDADGRVLKVDIPSTGFTAERTTR